MQRCDVLVVGGGPAGSSCAWALRRSGLDVVVADRSSFPRDKVCAGWITPAVLEALEVDTRRYASTRVLQPVVGFRVSMQGSDAVEIDYGHVVSWAIRGSAATPRQRRSASAGAAVSISPPRASSRPAGDRPWPHAR
jgi:flavin-dependent dehydrogenase